MCYALEPGELDLDRFERYLTEGRQALNEGDAERAADLLGAGLALWRGRPLADFEFEPFARVDVERLGELHLAAVEERIEAELALGRHGMLVPELEGLVGEHPLRERLRSQLMLALYRCGRQADALEAYRSGRTLLADELALAPSPQLRELEQAILRQDKRALSRLATGPVVAIEQTPVPTQFRPVRRRDLPACLAGGGGQSPLQLRWGSDSGSGSALAARRRAFAFAETHSLSSCPLAGRCAPRTPAGFSKRGGRGLRLGLGDAVRRR